MNFRNRGGSSFKSPRVMALWCAAATDKGRKEAAAGQVEGCEVAFGKIRNPCDTQVTGIMKHSLAS